jgi:hypothetical protein
VFRRFHHLARGQIGVDDRAADGAADRQRFDPPGLAFLEQAIERFGGQPQAKKLFQKSRRVQ